jgi:outer membrane lipoprotein-sorting protein
MLSTPREGEKRLQWEETTIVDGQSVWFSQEEVFKIALSEEFENYPIVLYVRVLRDQELPDDHECGIGPFHSLEAAQEAAERIWAGFLKGQVHRSQFRGSDYVAVASRVMFPNL